MGISLLFYKLSVTSKNEIDSKLFVFSNQWFSNKRFLEAVY